MLVLIFVGYSPVKIDTKISLVIHTTSISIRNRSSLIKKHGESIENVTIKEDKAK